MSLFKCQRESDDFSDDKNTPPRISSLEEDILTVLAGQPLYGLQICKAIEEASGGSRELKIGSLYPSLHRLENKGLVSSFFKDSNTEARMGNRRKYYRINNQGLRALHQQQLLRINLANWSPC